MHSTLRNHSCHAIRFFLVSTANPDQVSSALGTAGDREAIRTEQPIRRPIRGCNRLQVSPIAVFLKAVAERATTCSELLKS